MKTYLTDPFHQLKYMKRLCRSFTLYRDYSVQSGKGMNMQSLKIKGVQDIIAVASGKGGVGKSTTAVNLAVSLANKCRLSVGLLDADVYGPSIPTMMKLHGKPEVMKALEQLTRGVDWGNLDVLVVDMPPGTGDAQISISQRLQLSGALIVSTPQDVALMDARRGVNMFTKVAVPILGIIENMSYFKCLHCGEPSFIFGKGGARKTAEEMGLRFVGEIPLVEEVRSGSDDGVPIVVSNPDSVVAKSYDDLAQNIVSILEDLAKQQDLQPEISL
ncbi:iron-sulfur protein required for NADH dehydrogenase, mitochondrial isoform X2 [Apium graveolens]|uniref:iron-sulfur protein required for NADH dehydrogenase, mitochondrial isoform X2 n=1 Tax=Apium graveolens TaxID=4045 RepID=UPI003D78DD8A